MTKKKMDRGEQLENIEKSQLEQRSKKQLGMIFFHNEGKFPENNKASLSGYISSKNTTVKIIYLCGQETIWCQSEDSTKDLWGGIRRIQKRQWPKHMVDCPCI